MQLNDMTAKKQMLKKLTGAFVKKSPTRCTYVPHWMKRTQYYGLNTL